MTERKIKACKGKKIKRIQERISTVGHCQHPCRQKYVRDEFKNGGS